MSLDPREARPLTSREIAKIVSSVLIGFSTWCDIKDIESAIDHFAEHKEFYKQTARAMSNFKPVTLDGKNSHPGMKR